MSGRDGGAGSAGGGNVPAMESSPPVPAPEATPDPAGGAVELGVARLLAVGAVAAVVLIAIGAVLMVRDGIDPIVTAFPALDLGGLVPAMLALEAQGFLWTGLLVVLATPIAMVVVELAGFARRGEMRMALLALGILLIVVLSVLSAVILGG
jgi:uncharacterized membrane protein